MPENKKQDNYQSKYLNTETNLKLPWFEVDVNEIWNQSLLPSYSKNRKVIRKKQTQLEDILVDILLFDFEKENSTEMIEEIMTWIDIHASGYRNWHYVTEKKYINEKADFIRNAMCKIADAENVVNQIFNNEDLIRDLSDANAHFRPDLIEDFIHKLSSMHTFLRNLNKELPQKDLIGSDSKDVFNLMVYELCAIFLKFYSYDLKKINYKKYLNCLKKDCVRFVSTILYSYGIDLERSTSLAELPDNYCIPIPKTRDDRFAGAIRKQFDLCLNRMKSNDKFPPFSKEFYGVTDNP